MGKRRKVKVPRSRKREFRISLLPEKWRRDEEAGEKLVRALMRIGYGKNRVKSVLSRMGVK